MKFLRNAFNIITYWFLMILGIILVAGSIYVAIKYALNMGSDVATHINNFIAQVYSMMSLSNPPVLSNFVAKVVFATPFALLSLIGLITILLTQRTANANKRNKRKEKEKIESKQTPNYEASNNYSWMSSDQLKWRLNELNISFHPNSSKEDLLRLLNNRR